MRKKEWTTQIQTILDQLYPEPSIPLYHTDSYTLLIAVLLSAQCTDARVNKITPALFSHASTPQEMVDLGVEKIEDLIRTCGLGPRKARAIWELSKILIEKYRSNVPNSFQALESLPGVGHKTASVVMAQAFGVPAFPIDTHIHRCAKRWGLSSGKSVIETEKDLKRLFPRESWIKLHLQIIYFARQYCRAQPHNKESCPICSKKET
jgi:endonuclease III